MTHPETAVLPDNHLLEGLSDSARKRIRPHLKLVELSLGDVIYESGQHIDHVYFPIDSIVSLLYVTVNGASAEIAIIGNDGFVGVSVVLGADSTLNQAVVQSRGRAYRMSACKLKEELNNHSELRVRTLRYTQALITQMSQTAVCNRHHSIEQQLCRWLLLSLDRLRDNHIDMTHELIANMLGVRREGVTHAARRLQDAGAIHYQRGHITVTDRALLERLTCECYAVVKREANRLEYPDSLPAAQR